MAAIATQTAPQRHRHRHRSLIWHRSLHRRAQLTVIGAVEECRAPAGAGEGVLIIEVSFKSLLTLFVSILEPSPWVDTKL